MERDSCFTERRPSESGGGSTPANLALTKSKITWASFECGNFCYVTTFAADIRRPMHMSSHGGDVASSKLPRTPPPPVETRRGVTVRVARGTITLSRTDGRKRTIRPPGGAVDAELETTGLFYAYNIQATYPGRLAFVPFAKLFP